MSRYFAGDILVRRKGLVMHRGVALGDGRVLHNTPFRGEHVASEAQFSDGKRVYVEQVDRANRAQALIRAGESPSRDYNLFTNNSEHTVSRLTHGEPSSPQLRGIVAGLAAGVVVFGLTRHPGAAAASFAGIPVRDKPPPPISTRAGSTPRNVRK